MKTPLELVKSKVQEACPDVMNLEFGCRVILHDNDHNSIILRECPIFDEKVTDGPYYTLFQYNKPVNRKVIKQILGREIRLADVLRTIGDEPQKFFYYSTQEIRMDYLDKNDKIIEIWWDLAHDSLSWHAEHRPETVALLAEVLAEFDGGAQIVS